MTTPGADVQDGEELALRVARARWRSAEDRLYPGLLADPTLYRHTLSAVQAVVAELRRRADDTAGLAVAEQAAGEVVAVACPDGTQVSADLLVAVACGMLDRELTAEQDRLRRTAAVDAARAAGAHWAVLDGPASAEELTEGGHVALHLASGTIVTASVDPWAREDAFGLAVGGSQVSFGDRAEWLAELARRRAEIEAGHVVADT